MKIKGNQPPLSARESMEKGRFRRTRIVCTIGPATNSSDSIARLMEAGMDVARLNFSHGDRETHRETIRLIRKLSVGAGKEIGILQDLGGPKIRLGKISEDKRMLRHGEQVILFAGQSSDDHRLPVNYPELARDVKPGDVILMADGTVQLMAVEKKGEEIVCNVVVGGGLVSFKGVNLPFSHLSVKSLTEKDRLDLALGLAEKVDFVALSFVRSQRDIEDVRKILKKGEYSPMLIAKIEKPEAVEHFEKILAVVDGVMVARGDLGVEMPLEEIPIIQKRLIRMTRQAGKPVITATQMLTSMMENPRPTRAEATDVANAVLDGTDALMLSDETAIGNYPVDAVAVLDRIARSTEPYLDERAYLGEQVSAFLHTPPAAISRAACWLAQDLASSAIVASTSSGYTARLVARFRPSAPIMALTDRIETQRMLSLTWGVIPHFMSSFVDTDQMFASARAWAVEQGIAGPGDCLVITAGVPVGTSGTTNLLKVVEIT